MKMTWFWRRRGIIFGAFVLVLGACALDADKSVGDSGQPPSLVASPDSGSTEKGAVVVPEPFAGLAEIRAKYWAVIHEASELKVAECMKSKGFRYTPIHGQNFLERYTKRRFGDIKFAQAEGFGFGNEDNATPSSADDDRAGLSDSEAEAWTLALRGSAIEDADDNDSNVVVLEGEFGKLRFRKDSCSSAGMAAVVGDIAEWRQVDLAFDDMQNRVANGVETDDHWLNVTDKWSKCVRNSGFNYSSLGEFADDLAKQISAGLSLADAKVREIDFAVASAKCELDFGMGSLYLKLQEEWENKVSGESQATIIRFGELQQQAGKQADNMLGAR